MSREKRYLNVHFLSREKKTLYSLKILKNFFILKQKLIRRISRSYFQYSVVQKIKKYIKIKFYKDIII